MIYFILYVVSILVAIPIIGRAFEKYTPDDRYQGSTSLTCGIVYGIMWPVFIVLFVLMYLWDHRPDSGLLRKYVTGR